MWIYSFAFQKNGINTKIINIAHIKSKKSSLFSSVWNCFPSSFLNLRMVISSSCHGPFQNFGNSLDFKWPWPFLSYMRGYQLRPWCLTILKLLLSHIRLGNTTFSRTPICHLPVRHSCFAVCRFAIWAQPVCHATKMTRLGHYCWTAKWHKANRLLWQNDYGKPWNGDLGNGETTSYH